METCCEGWNDNEDTIMNDKARRKELLAQYKQTHPEAGVYRIINGENGKVLLGSASKPS